MGTSDMDSVPPATITCAAPPRMRSAACAMACRPLAQKRFTVIADVSTGRPARREAMRATFIPCSPSGMAQPRITSSISLGSRPGTCAIAALITSAAKSSGRVVRSEPLNPRPTGVRTEETMTASAMGNLFGPESFRLSAARRKKANPADGYAFGALRCRAVCANLRSAATVAMFASEFPGSGCAEPHEGPGDPAKFHWLSEDAPKNLRRLAREKIDRCRGRCVGHSPVELLFRVSVPARIGPFSVAADKDLRDTPGADGAFSARFGFIDIQAVGDSDIAKALQFRAREFEAQQFSAGSLKLRRRLQHAGLALPFLFAGADDDGVRRNELLKGLCIVSKPGAPDRFTHLEEFRPVVAGGCEVRSC